MANTGNTQQQINYGAAVNDGNGDPLRTAFIKTDDNFDNVWLAGPVGSNITITNNTVQANNTNGNLILSPNGTGVIQTNSRLLPRLNNTYDLGSTTQKYRSGYFGIGGLTVDGNVNITGNLTAGNISYTSNVFVGDLEGSVFADDSTIMVDAIDNVLYAGRAAISGNVSATYFIGNGSQLTGLAATYGNANVVANLAALGSNPISTTGNVTANYFVGNGSLLTGIVSSYGNANVANYLPTFSGNISAGNVSAVGNITGNYFFGNGSQLTGLPVQYGNSNVTTLLSNLGSNIISGTGNITTTGNISGAYVKGNGSELTNLPAPAVTQDITSNGAMSIMTYDGVIKYVSYATVEPSSGNITGGNISTTGNVTANYFIGDGSQLTNLPGGNATLPLANGTSNFDIATANGNVTVAVAGARTWTFDTTGNVTIPGNIVGAATIDIDNRATGNGADIQLYSADDILLQARDRSAGSTSEGGDINIFAGDSAEDSDNSGGDIVIEAGRGGASNIDFGGVGGFVRVEAGQGGNAIGANFSAQSGGDLTLRAGDAGTNNGNIDLGNSGGDVIINAGDSTGNGDPGGTIYLTSGAADASALAGSVVIQAGGTWTFDGDGNLNLPMGGVVYETNIPDGGLSGSAIALKPTGGTNADQELLIYPTVNDANHLHLTTGNLYNTELFLGDDNLYVKLANTGNIVVNANNNTGNSAQWNFSTNGTLTLPAGSSRITSYGQITIETDNNASGMYLNADGVNLLYANANVTLRANSIGTNKDWDFGTDGNLTLPGNIIAINYLNGNRVTGGVTFDGEAVIGTGTSNTQSGLYLAPDPVSLTNDLYLRVRGNIQDEPTHIHFDTGNNQYYNQFIGDDNKYVQLANTGNIVINTSDYAGNTAQWTFDTTGNLTLPGGSRLNPSGSNLAIFAGGGYVNLITADESSRMGVSGAGGFITTAGGTWQFGTTGNLTLPGNTFAVNYANGNPVTFSGGSGNTGNVTFDDQAVVGTGDQVGGSGLYLAPGTESVGNLQYIRVRGGDVATHIHLDTGNNAYFDQYFGDDGKYVKLEATGNIVIGSNDAEGNSAQWTFDTTGNLTFPTGNLVITPDAVAFGNSAVIASEDHNLITLSTGANGGVSSLWVEDLANATSNIAAVYANPTPGSGIVRIAVGANGSPGPNLWDFDHIGRLTLPGGSQIRPLGANLDIVAGTGAYVNLTTSDESSSVGVDNGGGYIVTAGGQWLFGTTGNLTAPGNISAVGNVTAGNISAGSGGAITMTGGNITGANVVTANSFVGNGATLSNVATQVSSSWTVPVGNSTQSFTVDGNNSYQMWVEGNIPNGIIVWNATVSVTNTNVPVIGQQFAWNYEGGGNILMFTSIPAQIIGTAGAISNAQPAVANTNVFSFGINNTSGNTVTVNYGYTKIS